MAKKRSLEQVYPDKKAREYADLVIDELALDATMLEFIIAWEEAYLSAGGTIHP